MNETEKKVSSLAPVFEFLSVILLLACFRGVAAEQELDNDVRALRQSGIRIASVTRYSDSGVHARTRDLTRTHPAIWHGSMDTIDRTERPLPARKHSEVWSGNRFMPVNL